MPMELVTELPYNHPYRWDGTQFGGPVLWRPSNIGSDLALWLDAEDAASITLNGSTVSQWNDKSGNGRNATQTTAVRQPTYTAAGLSGKPMLRFVSSASTQQFLISYKFAAPNTDFAVFTVMSSDSTAGNDGNVFGLDGGGYLINGLYAQNANTGIGYYLNRTGASVNVASASSINANTLGIAGFVHTSSNSATAYNNGNAGSTVNSINWVAGDDSNFNLGAYQIGTNQAVSLKGYIAEHIVITASLSTTNRQRIEGYLAWKWKLQANLPSNHPFKNLPPTA